MTTVDLLARCQTRKFQHWVPDLIGQRQMHLEENLKPLRDDATPSGFHDMYINILVPRSTLTSFGRRYATILFEEDPACNKQQK